MESTGKDALKTDTEVPVTQGGQGETAPDVEALKDEVKNSKEEIRKLESLSKEKDEEIMKY
jgi:hypothetical protein